MFTHAMVAFIMRRHVEPWRAYLFVETEIIHLNTNAVAMKIVFQMMSTSLTAAGTSLFHQNVMYDGFPVCFSPVRKMRYYSWCELGGQIC